MKIYLQKYVQGNEIDLSYLRIQLNLKKNKDLETYIDFDSESSFEAINSIISTLSNSQELNYIVEKDIIKGKPKWTIKILS